MRAFDLVGRLLLVAAPLNAAENLRMEEARGLSNISLCQALAAHPEEPLALLREVRMRTLDCTVVDPTDDEAPLTPAAGALAERGSQIDIPQRLDRASRPTSPLLPPSSFSSTEGLARPPSIVRIRTQETSGSGFYLDSTHLLTNAHVVNQAKTVVLTENDGPSYPGTVVFKLADLDLALIETLTPGIPATLQRQPPREGEGVLALGYPQGRITLAASTGTLHEILPCCLVHDAMMAAGSSGGPLLDASHRVIGINTLIRKRRGDRANSSDRGIALRMDDLALRFGRFLSSP